MTLTTSVPTPKTDYESACLAAGFVFVISLSALLAGVLLVVGVPATPATVAHAASLYFHLSQLPIFPDATFLACALILAVMAAGTVFFIVGAEIIGGGVHVAGGQLRDGADAAADEIRRESGLSPTEFAVAGIKMTLDRIRRSFVIFGSIGGGKTQVMWNLLLRLVNAGFKILLVDGPKGDYSAAFPSPAVVIVAPWHKGPAWHVARDCTTRAHARELSARVIPISEKEPLWGNAAGMAFVAVVCRYQVEKPGEWGFHDIVRDISGSIESLKIIAARYYPPAVQALADAESKTTQSIVINLTAFMLDIYELAQAWEHATERFSFTEWWRDDNDRRSVILQGSGEFKSLAGGYISSIIGTLADLTASPSFPESQTRKIVIAIDEAAQLPRINGLEKIYETGRSKGCSVVLATQSPAQLRKIYGQDDLSALLAMVGTKIFVRIVGADDAEVAMRELGKREVLLPTISTTAAGQQNALGNARQTGGQQNITHGWQRDKIDVVRQDQLAQLGPIDDGIAAIVAGIGPDPIRVTFPYYTAQAFREPIIPNPDFNRHAIEAEAPADTSTDAATVGEYQAAEPAELPADSYTRTMPEVGEPKPTAESVQKVPSIELPSMTADDIFESRGQPEGEAIGEIEDKFAAELISPIMDSALGADLAHALDLIQEIADVQDDAAADHETLSQPCGCPAIDTPQPSHLRPWDAEGVSRSTWYRRQRKRETALETSCDGT